MELWEPQRDAAQLGLRGGDYGERDEFHRLSALMKFPEGVGLPGQVLAAAAPRVLRDLGEPGEFVRSLAARSVGLRHGLGFPVLDGPRVASVVVILTGRGRPLVHRLELWTHGPRGFARAAVADASEPTGGWYDADEVDAARAAIDEAAATLRPRLAASAAGELGLALPFAGPRGPSVVWISQ